MLSESRSLTALNCAVADVEVLDWDLNLVSFGLDLAAGIVFVNGVSFLFSVLDEITRFIKTINA